MADAVKCFRCLLLGATPLSIVTLLLLRAASPLDPHVVSILCGVACAAAGAVMLSVAHPHYPAALDIIFHAAAIAIVIGANVLIGRHWLREKKAFST
jgi:hypothetical protein